MLRSVVRCVAALLCAALGSVFFPPAAAAPAPDEVRALWVVRTTLTSPAAIASMVASAKAGGFNTLLVQVRGRGDAYFQNGPEPRPATLSSQPAFDPLQTAIAQGHAAGLRVHAWINVNLVAGLDLPSAREHVVYRHPEWLMVPRALAGDLSRVNVRSPEYLGRLVRYARQRSADVEGLYLSPVSPGSAAYTVGIIRDIAERYAVDGVHLDYIRYPQDDFDYGRDTVSEYERAVAPAARSIDRWHTFRTERLTSLLVHIREAVKRARPEAMLSAAVHPDPDVAAVHRMQDWRAWMAGDLLDVICPMAYTTDAALFASQIAAVRDVAGTHDVWAGIGAYRLSQTQIVENVQAARRIGAGGVILFSYDSLADPSRGPGYLAHVGRAAFMQ
jgi:uncharacterized lipoprotein YddW (UPF0748 family)